MKVPEIPAIDDEESVVRWFLEYDEKIEDFRSNFPNHVEAAVTDILTDLQDYADSASLKAHVESIADFHGTRLLPTIAQLKERGQPFSDDDIQVFLVEAVAAVKIRILGYFLLKKYGVTLAP